MNRSFRGDITAVANGRGSGWGGVVVEARAAGSSPSPDLAWDLVSETHLVPQFPHDASWLRTGED